MKAVPFHTLPPGRIVNIMDHNNPRYGLTVEPIHGGPNCDVVLLPSIYHEPATNYAYWDATSFETSPSIEFQNIIVSIDPNANGILYDRNNSLIEGHVYLIEGRLALCSYYPQQLPKVRFLHWLDDGMRAQPRVAYTIAFPKWSILTPLRDTSPLVLFNSQG
jgi:hypothetical protein